MIAIHTLNNDGVINNNTITQNKLSDIAGKAKLVSPDDQMIVVAKDMGVSFGDE